MPPAFLPRIPHAALQKITREWHKHCLKECDPAVKRYWVCRQEEGFLAPFTCRGQNQEMIDCVHECARDDDKFAPYRDRRLTEETERAASLAAAAAAEAAKAQKR